MSITTETTSVQTGVTSSGPSTTEAAKSIGESGIMPTLPLLSSRVLILPVNQNLEHELRGSYHSQIYHNQGVEQTAEHGTAWINAQLGLDQWGRNKKSVYNTPQSLDQIIIGQKNNTITSMLVCIAALEQSLQKVNPNGSVNKLSRSCSRSIPIANPSWYYRAEPSQPTFIPTIRNFTFDGRPLPYNGNPQGSASNYGTTPVVPAMRWPPRAPGYPPKALFLPEQGGQPEPGSRILPRYIHTVEELLEEEQWIEYEANQAQNQTRARNNTRRRDARNPQRENQPEAQLYQEHERDFRQDGFAREEETAPTFTTEVGFKTMVEDMVQKKQGIEVPEVMGKPSWWIQASIDRVGATVWWALPSASSIARSYYHGTWSSTDMGSETGTRRDPTESSSTTDAPSSSSYIPTTPTNSTSFSNNSPTILYWHSSSWACTCGTLRILAYTRIDKYGRPMQATVHHDCTLPEWKMLWQEVNRPHNYKLLSLSTLAIIIEEVSDEDN
ncbi:OLC1v1024204C1 [Oldenlandia corymbosa var. corymbosa]|uniref:OLC1v1024204C1 n=1 Tax=Oldenlandia corymbosa var. corymbosa TaxID=529605 RepID=A0AAV1C3G5_OLDCO|nr:OLC1v1024204C1 [Oldenlandia corymbosa var. corymbosa]